MTPDGGPKSQVRHGCNGFIAEDAEFPGAIAQLLRDGALRARMGAAARTYALSASWDAVFEGVYAAYGAALETPSTANA